MTDPIDLLSPDVRRDPYPAYARLRDAPVQKIEAMGAWAVSRYEDVAFVLKNPALFSSAGMQAYVRPGWLPENPIGDALHVKDGSEHTRLRALVGRAFAPSSIAAVEPRVRQLAEETAEAMVGASELDFVASFATPFPAKVIAEILGFDTGELERFERWAGHIASINPIEPPPEHVEAVRRTIAEMSRYIHEVIESRTAEPRDDFATHLIQAEVDGQRLSTEEVVSFMSLLLPAGFETTRPLLTNIMFRFLEQPELYAMLRDDPSKIDAFVKEALRFDPPVQGLARTTTAEVELGGTTVPENSMVFILIGAASRDPDYVDEPDRFDVEREQAGLLSFGHGPHYCVGAALSRLEAKLAIEALLARFSGFERAGEVVWNLSPSVRAPTKLPIRLLR